MDKSLKILGTKIAATQKTCDDKLKKLTDDTNEIKSKLMELVKKDSPSFMAKDLGDLVYERKIKKDYFVNTYYDTKMLVTVLVVVNKKNIDKFVGSYMYWLTDFYAQDYEKWQQRTTMQIKNEHMQKGDNLTEE